MKPGVYSDISNEAYHGGPGISKSGLDLIHRSPMHYKAVIDNPQERQATPAQILGTAFHSLVLEPEIFTQTYCLALRQSDVPHAIDDREILVKMVQEINAIRAQQHPQAITDSQELVSMLEDMNKNRLPKLSTSGRKEELIDRLLEACADWAEENKFTREQLEEMKGTELKTLIEKVNEHRAGLLSTSGSTKELAQRLRDNGAEFELWSEILDKHLQEHGTPYIGSVSGSRHDMANWLRANGKEIVLWDDVKAEWMQNNAHRIVLSQETWDQLHGMRNSVMSHPAAHAILTGRPGKAEQSIYWIDPETGVLCRCRPDWWRDDDLLADLKSTDDASPEGFAKSVANWRYDVQDPFYCDGLFMATGRKARGFVFIAVEKKPPYAVGVYVLDEESRELGRAQYRADLAVFAESSKNDSWPGYGDKIQQISVPAWHANKNQHLLDN